MNAPRVENDGFRYYNRWAGNPDGTREDRSRCIARVADGSRGLMFVQCSRKRGHGPDGLFCKQHDPEAVAKRQIAADRRYALKMAEERAARERPLREARRAALLEAAEKAELPGTELLDGNGRVAAWLRSLAEEEK